MADEDRAKLIETLQRFLSDAAKVIDSQDDGASTRQSVQAFAQLLAAVPTCNQVNALAHQTSLSVGYLLAGLAGRPSDAGRRLDADALISTGLVTMLVDHAEVDLQAVASDLAGYLAGPPTDIWDYAILDGTGDLQDAIQIADGWELVTPTAEELRAALPLPSTAAYQPNRPFNPNDYSHLTMLRRINFDAKPHRGFDVDFDVLFSVAVGRTQQMLLEPLIALSLYTNDALHLRARYRIEPQRRTDKQFDFVSWEVWTPDGNTEIERPITGTFDIDASAAPKLRHFLMELSLPLSQALNTRAARRIKKADEAANRLRRCAEHFLMAGEHVYGEGETLLGQDDDAVLHYVIALEGLLAGGERGDLTRKVGQRAAVLAGVNDTERLAIRKLVADAYGARSEYAHGDGPNRITKIDFPKLRSVVRRCLLARIILGDPSQVGPLHELADRALLAHGELQDQIRHPLDEFARRAYLAPPAPNYPR